jgi:hypothetical protein
MAFPKLGSPTKRRSRGPALAVGQRYLALCHDDRRGLSLAERRGLTFARAASNAQCQQQRTHDSDESIHGAPHPVSVLMAGLSNRPVRSPTSAEKPHITTSSNRHSGPAQALQPQLNRDFPDDPRAGVHIGAFPAFQQDRCEVWTATSTSGSPNGGRASNLAIFAGIWTHGSRRLLLNP